MDSLVQRFTENRKALALLIKEAEALPLRQQIQLPPEIRSHLPAPDDELFKELDAIGLWSYRFQNLHDFDFRVTGDTSVYVRFSRGNCGDDAVRIEFPSYRQAARAIMDRLIEEDKRSY